MKPNKGQKGTLLVCIVKELLGKLNPKLSIDPIGVYKGLVNPTSNLPQRVRNRETERGRQGERETGRQGARERV